MIVCRRPFVLYDVDLIGLGVIASLLVGAWFVVGRPWQATWSEYRVLATQRNTIEANLQRDMRELERFEIGLAQLRQRVDAKLADVPRPTSVPALLRKMTDLARAANLELLSVAPAPAKEQDAYLVSDVNVVGRGRSLDFIRFLDLLAQENPYQCLKTCRLSRPPVSSSPTCEISWTMRLYLLPRAESVQDGGA